jgi:hypothetical protein
MTDGELAERVAALEAQVAELARARPHQPPAPSSGADEAPDEDQFWVLDGLRRRAPDGAVLYAGDVPLPTGEHYRWQWARLVPELVATDWTDLAAALAALGNPVRLRLLQRVLTGTRTAAELAGGDELGTTGQLYHHLRQLVAAGWLHSSGRGQYAVPAERVVPLLAILMGAQR